MFENSIPKHKVGVLLPLAIVDNAAYEFYRLAPPGVMLVMIPIGLAEFSAADVERALFKPLASNLDKLMERGVNMVVQSGTRELHTLSYGTPEAAWADAPEYPYIVAASWAHISA